MTTQITFEQLVEECTNSRTSDLEHAVRGLFLYARDNGSEADINQFMDWFNSLGENDSLFGRIHTSTLPSDWFECGEGKDWDFFETYYQES